MKRVAQATVTIAACALGACAFNESGIPADGDGGFVDPTGPDGGARFDAAPGCEGGWAPLAQHFDPCSIAAPGGPLVLDEPGVYTYFTGLAMLVDPDGLSVTHVADVVDHADQSARLISTERFELGPDSTLHAVGSLPLIVASWSSIDIDGLIDVGSTRGVPGAGADQPICAASAATPGVPAANGGGGGGGGAFAGDGGNGGDGKGAKGDGGVAAPTPGYVRGGCAGASGGDGALATGGNGGPGGGAIQLTARDRVTISGAIAAGGGGGAGGGLYGGGGGGGSGGYIGLDASLVVLAPSSHIVAYGGGGGEGGDVNDLGNPGEDATVDNALAAGGKGGADKGGDGGSGGVANMPDGSNGKKSDAGGGGGGGAGFIRIFANTLDGTLQ